MISLGSIMCSVLPVIFATVCPTRCEWHVLRVLPERPNISRSAWYARHRKTRFCESSDVKMVYSTYDMTQLEAVSHVDKIQHRQHSACTGPSRR